MAKKVKVQEYMQNLDHPLKAEIEVVRDIIKGVHPEIQEEIKWNAPSYSYKGNYLVTFNLRAAQHVHLVFHNPEISKVNNEILEGSYIDRRMTYLTSMEDIDDKKVNLQVVIRELIAIIDR
jgi:uncharacterized protein YdhG (YjbR/CyaY superfamily)